MRVLRCCVRHLSLRLPFYDKNFTQIKRICFKKETFFVYKLSAEIPVKRWMTINRE
jgi:hypothetical protein